MKKLIFLSILFIGLSATGFSQSKKALKKIEKKATELVEKLNKEITAGDKNLALSDEQKAQVKKIQIERISGLRKLGKEATKEEKKKLNKSFYKKIYKVLSKEQKDARKKSKSKK